MTVVAVTAGIKRLVNRGHLRFCSEAAQYQTKNKTKIFKQLRRLRFVKLQNNGKAVNEKIIQPLMISIKGK